MEAMKTTTSPPEALREEDLVPGRPWVHPETHLEYEDFHAFFCGKEPLPHWRNAAVKRVLQGEQFFGPKKAAAAIEHLFRDFDKDGRSRFGISHDVYARNPACVGRTVTCIDGIPIY